MERTAEHQLRAYVFVEDTAVTEDGPERLRIRVSMKNFGVTPATNVRHWIGYGIRSHPLTEALPIITEKTQRRAAVGPGAAYPTTFERQFNATEYAAITSGEGFRFHVFGAIEYQDIFGRRQVQPYSFVLANREPGVPLALAWRATDHGPDPTDT